MDITDRSCAKTDPKGGKGTLRVGLREKIFENFDRFWYNFSMEKITVDGPKMPIGFLTSLWKGIEYVNNHPGILIFPVLLDGFLWFGPRLSIFNLITPWFEWMTTQASGDPQTLVVIDAALKSFEKFNVFSLLSFIPLYPPSLMGDVAPVQNPLGTPAVFSIADPSLFLLFLLGLPLVSLLFGSVYWVAAGYGMRTVAGTLRETLAGWVRTAAVAVLLTASFFVVMLVFGAPLLFVVILIGGASPVVGAILGQAVIILGGSFLFWLVLFVMFSVHGTALFGDGVIAAIGNSINTSRWLYPMSIWIPILLIMLYFLSSSVWSLAPAEGWTGAVGILGNAYTGSVIVAASMAYYIDKRRWIDEVKIHLQTRLAEKIPPPAA
jgi:hypothetical protein